LIKIPVPKKTGIYIGYKHSIQK